MILLKFLHRAFHIWPYGGATRPKERTLPAEKIHDDWHSIQAPFGNARPGQWKGEQLPEARNERAVPAGGARDRLQDWRREEDLLLVDPVSIATPPPSASASAPSQGSRAVQFALPSTCRTRLIQPLPGTEFQLYGTQPPTSMFQSFLPFPFVPQP